MNSVGSRIPSFIQTLRDRNLDVSGPIKSGNVHIYEVNGHTLTEDELRVLANNDRLTTWDIYSYVKSRTMRRRASA